MPLEIVERMRSVNEKLWNIEDDIRIKEHRQEFDENFIEMARSVYITNDRRSEIKRKISSPNKTSAKD